MTTNDESTSTDKQSPGNPPGTSGRFLRTPTPGALDPNFGERIESLKQAIESILKDTKWPSESKNAANELLNTVKSSPNIPSNAATSSQDLITKYIQILENVEAQLKDAKSKAGMRRWKLLEGIKSIAPNHQSKCTLLFKTCQDDVSKVVMSIKEFLENERKKEEDLAASGISPETQAGLTVHGAGRAPSPLSTNQTQRSEQSIAPSNPTSGASPSQDPLSGGLDEERSRGPVRQEALTIARKIFKAADAASGSIPVAGTFVAAGAKVGLAFVETIQTMDKNDDLAKDLASQTGRLSKCLASFNKPLGADQGQEIANHVNGLQKELQRVHVEVEEWKSRGRFNKAFHARDHGESLKGHQGTIQTAMEEIQLLVGLNTHSIVIELKNNEVQEKQRRLLKCLGDGKYGAQGNSIQDVTCFPGTRVEILERIDDWIRNSSASDRVLWLRGMAGRGKSTIASTVVENWKCRASCAIFHFRRGQTTLNTRAVCALTRQLAGSLVPEVRNAVLDGVREKEDIADERLEEQFKTLFVASLAKLHNQPHPILVVVDALDECDNPKDAVAFIRLIHEHSASFPPNVKFLLTSRPDAQLLRAPELRKWRSEDLDTAPDVSSDLERFIQQACKQIRDTDSDVPQTWPSSEDVNRLVDMSQGLFQWARTVITYVGDGSPVDRLRGLLEQPSVWGGLDELYHQILSKAFDTVKLDAGRGDLLRRVLGTLAVAPYPVSLDAIAGLYGNDKIFGGTDRAGIMLFLRKDILADLNSLLFIPTSSAEPIRLMHTSVRDLLVSEHRCKQPTYYVNVIHHHGQLAGLCLDSMIRDLRENICNLSDLSKPASEIRDVTEKNVPRALLYCCRSWSIHLTEGVQWPIQGRDATSLKPADFETFSKEKLMCWLEVMSLAGATKDAIMMAKRVCEWLGCPNDSGEYNSLATMWNDVQRFITTFSEPIQFGPLHIYVSALPHCPVETEIWKLYRHLAKVQTIKGLTASTWSSNIWVRSIGRWVGTVAFSPNGKILASGSGDWAVRLWDAQTGTVIGEPLTGHSDFVQSVCFSPDGNVLASGSSDNTIRLWDTQAGTAIGKQLAGHSNCVNSICFSPDGKVLASGSDDKTIRLWDTRTGTVICEPITGHSDWVWSVCFSPSGKVLASGSKDQTIRLWDIQTGTLIGEPLTGHSGEIISVCFSPDGKFLASGSSDETIRLWDTTQTGTGIGKPMAGHRSSISSVCLSPDGKFLASVSDDQTIQFWDTQTGTAIGEPVTGHSSRVTSVCLSPDGNVLASGDKDGTIRLWDTQTRTAIGKPLKGHSVHVYSVCFSPDGKVLASGSYDVTIRLWETETGTVIGEPLTGHRDTVRSVCFSPDGQVLASGSEDMTIRLWDPQTGTAIGEPLTGHEDYVRSVCFSPDGSLLGGRYWNGNCATWDAVTRQRCDTPRSLPRHWNPTFQDHWVVFSSSRFIWLPPQYWEGDPDFDIVLLSGSTLAVLRDRDLSLFDVSQALEL